MRHNKQILGTLMAGIILTIPLLGACVSLERESRADAGGTLTIDNVWARSEHAGENSAVYLEIANTGNASDVLLGASADVAGSTEIHEVLTENDVMKMREVSGIEIPAGESTVLEPGGLHVMLFGLTGDLEPGDAFELTLTFDAGGEIQVTAEVREHTPGQGHGG